MAITKIPKPKDKGVGAASKDFDKHIAPVVKTTAAHVTTTTTHKSGAEVQETQQVGLTQVHTKHPAVVSVSNSFTKNLGNYESCKIQIDISLPCDVCDIDATYTMACDWVETKLADKLAELDESLK